MWQISYVIMEYRGALYIGLEAPMVKSVNNIVFVTNIEHPSMCCIDCSQIGRRDFACVDLVLWQRGSIPAWSQNTQ